MPAAIDSRERPETSIFSARLPTRLPASMSVRQPATGDGGVGVDVGVGAGVGVGVKVGANVGTGVGVNVGACVGVDVGAAVGAAVDCAELPVSGVGVGVWVGCATAGMRGDVGVGVGVDCAQHQGRSGRVSRALVPVSRRGRAFRRERGM